MSEEEPKSRLHIHLGGLIIVIIIILVLFKVDIKEKIESPQFQKNISYIEDIWQERISIPLREKASFFFKNFTEKGVEKLQENFNEKVFKIPSEQDIENLTN